MASNRRLLWSTRVNSPNVISIGSTVFSAICNIYFLRLCYDVSVRLSVTEVHWVAVHAGNTALRQPAKLKPTSDPQQTWPPPMEGSSRAMLATARPSCLARLTVLSWPTRRHTQTTYVKTCILIASWPHLCTLCLRYGQKFTYWKVSCSNSTVYMYGLLHISNTELGSKFYLA